MTVAPHFAARQQFLTVLDEFFARGCERWQRDELNWRSADELPVGEAATPLFLARFVREICGEATWKLWMALRKGAANADSVALRTRRVFDQFLVRTGRNRYFREEEIEELRRYFDLHFWKIEDAWLDGQRMLAERGELFAELGGPRAVAAIKTDVQEFYEWVRRVIGEAYGGNDYQRALQIGEAVVQESAALIGRDFDDRDIVLGLCAVQEAACIATMVRLNCWSPEPGGFLPVLDEIAKKRLSPANLKGRALNDVGRFVTVATSLKAICRRFETTESMEPSLIGIYRMLGYLRFHQGIRARVAGEAQASVDSMTVTLMLTEAVNLRADWLRSFGLYRRMRDVPGFEDQARVRLSRALGEEEESGLVDATLTFMADPHRLIEDEWSAIEGGTASGTGWNDVALALLGAKVWLHHDGVDLVDSYAWLGRARKKLEGCAVHLAWSDFYCACDSYMEERGNPTLCDYALNSVRKLQRKAGNASAVEHFETGALEIASRRKKKPPSGDAPDDMELQWFLREEPFSLSRRD